MIMMPPAKRAPSDDLPGIRQTRAGGPECVAKPQSKRFGGPLAPPGFRPPYVRNHCYAGAHSGTS
jgi:hypothetical protein